MPSASEAFFVILEPGEAPPMHVHEDAEQVFYILEGEGEMTVGRDDAGDACRCASGDFVRTPPGTPHAVRATGRRRFVYLSIDCFTAGPTARRAHMGQPRPGDVRATRLGLRRRAARAGRARCGSATRSLVPPPNASVSSAAGGMP